MEFDATEIANLIKAKQLSPKEAVMNAFSEIKTKNGQLNAVVSLREEKALEEAKRCVDLARPFAGVPILLKSLGQYLKGEPATDGSKLFKDAKATQTDNFVKALQQAGFIIIGQSNAPEFGFTNVTDSKLYGPARNPWNPEFYSGGSSGGAASAVASKMVPLAAASDGGGSIRIPASFTGLIGLKPTRGRTPVGPSSWRGWQGASVSFAITRSIRDTASLLAAVQTVQPPAPFQTPLLSFNLEDPLPKNRKVAFSLNSPVQTKVSEAAKQAVLSAVNFLEEQGFEVEENEPKLDGTQLIKDYYLVNDVESAVMFSNIENALERKLKIDDMELISWCICQAGMDVKATDYSRMLANWDQAAFVMDAFLEKYSFFLTPTTAQTAPEVSHQFINESMRAKMRRISELSSRERTDLVYEFFMPSLVATPFTQQANLMGNPAISLPVHVASNGLPLGVQFVAKKGREDLLLKMGKLFEQNGKFRII